MARPHPQSHRPPRLSEIELCAWIAQAEPGAVLEYHRGYLALDRTAFGRFADTPARAALGAARQPRPRPRRARPRAPRPAPPRRRGLQLLRHRPAAPRRRAAGFRIAHHHRGGRVVNAPANRPQLGDIRTMPIGEIAALPAPMLALLQEEAEEAAEGRAHTGRLAATARSRCATPTAPPRPAAPRARTPAPSASTTARSRSSPTCRRRSTGTRTSSPPWSRRSAPRTAIRPNTSTPCSASRSASTPPGRATSAPPSSGRAR